MPSLFFRLSSSRSFLVLHSFIPSSLLLYLPSHNVICTPASGCCVCSAPVRLVGDTLHAFFSQYVRSIRLFQLEFHQISLLFSGSERCITLQDSNHKQHFYWIPIMPVNFIITIEFITVLRSCYLHNQIDNTAIDILKRTHDYLAYTRDNSLYPLQINIDNLMKLGRGEFHLQLRPSERWATGA